MEATFEWKKLEQEDCKWKLYLPRDLLSITKSWFWTTYYKWYSTQVYLYFGICPHKLVVTLFGWLHSLRAWVKALGHVSAGAIVARKTYCIWIENLNPSKIGQVEAKHW